LARETKKIEEEKEMKNGMKSAVLALREAATQKQILTNLKNKTRLTARAAAPIFGAVLLNLLIHEAARAQSGGPIFSGNANNLANIIREGLKLFAILLFCGGALGSARRSGTRCGARNGATTPSAAARLSPSAQSSR
jgi:hypothetical protein